MKIRYLIVLAAIFALVLTGANAQDAGGELCFDLSPEDCAVINAASEATNAVTSFVMNYSLDVTASGLELLMMLDPSIPAALNLAVTGSGPVVFGENFGMDLTNSATLDGETGELRFVLADGYLVSDLPNAQGEVNLVGVPLEASDEALAATGIGDLLPLDTTGMNAEEAPATLGELFGLEDLADMDVMVDPAIEPFFTYQRLEDVEMMGQAMSPFEFTADLTGLLQSPMGQELTGMAGALTGGDEMMAQMIPMLISTIESNVVITQYVGADDGLIHKLTFVLDFSLNLGPMMGAPAEGEGAMPPIVLNTVFDVELSDINSDLTVSLPEGATLLAPEEVEEYFGLEPMGAAG